MHSATMCTENREQGLAMTAPVLMSEQSSHDTELWMCQAACRNVEPDRLFVRGAAQRAATTICRDCPVQLQCLADALDRRVEFGVWGGLTERERRRLLRTRPDVPSWRAHLEAVQSRATRCR